MKRLANWTIGSFFRTIGRILAYFSIAFLLFYFCQKLDINIFGISKLSALENNQNIITYNYNDSFVIENHNSDFFGESGYLNQLKDFVDSISNSNRDWIIFFTKNDIIVVNPVSTYYHYGRYSLNFNTSKFYFQYYDEDTQRNYIYKLSNYNNNINNLKTAIQSRIDYVQFNNGAYNIKSFDVSQDLRYTDFNYFDYFDDYLIPYYSTYNLNYICNNSNFCENLSINGHTFTFNDTIPTYYKLYGYYEPSNQSLRSTVYNNAFIIDTDYIDESIGYYYFMSADGVMPVVSDIKIYGLVNDNGLEHYELLNSNIISLDAWEDRHDYHDYCHSPDGLFFQCEISLAEFTHGDLSSYEKIYVEFIYDNPIVFLKNSYGTHLNSVGTLNIILNDVCSDCLFLQLDTSGRNTYTFSNSNINSSYQLYYTDVISNGVLYNSPAFIDLQNNRILDSNIKVVSYSSRYGTFNKILFNDYQLDGDYGLVMNELINNFSNFNISGSFQQLFYLTPNLYWSNSTYSETRDSLSGCILDSSGSCISFTINGDFTNHLADYPNVSRYFNILNGIISDDFYGLSGLILTPLNYIRTLNDQVCNPIVFPVPFTNKNITIPCMSNIYNEYLGDLISLWHIVIYGVISYAIGVNIFKTIKDSLEADKNDVEVLDL